MTMQLKPQDLLVVLKRAMAGDDELSYQRFARSLGMRPSEVHAATKRAAAAGLLRRSDLRVNRSALLEFILHGVKYVFVPERSGLARGVPTGYAAPPLAEHIDPGIDPPPVWPDPH